MMYDDNNVLFIGALSEDHREVRLSSAAMGEVYHHEWQLPTAHELSELPPI